jgi:CRP/FNR family transcriptional regulator
MNGKQVRLDPSVFSQGIFRALPEPEWRGAAGLPPPVVLDRKGLLYEEGTVATHVYLVCSGLVKTFRSPSEDRVQIISIHGGGDVLGVDAVSGGTYRESAAALMRTVAYRVRRESFVELVERHPELSVTLITRLNDEVERIRTLLVDVGTKKALPRVASCILLFMDKQAGDGRSEPFNLPISRQEMGAFLGLSPETVSRQLKGLVSSRVIRLDHRRLTVLDVGQLRSIAAVT